MIKFGPSGNSESFYAAGYKHTEEAALFVKERAGQPTLRQALQPIHLSALTLRGGLCLTVLRSAQGRLEITTAGPSDSRAFLMPSFVSARL